MSTSSTAHKARDTSYDQIVKSAFQEFTRLEREFLLALPPSDCKALGVDGDRANIQVASHMRHHVEFLLTLKGIKPCMIIYHGRDTVVFTRLVHQVLKPLVDKYNLEEYGFTLRQVPNLTLMEMGRPQPDKFFKDGWLFADTLALSSNSWTPTSVTGNTSLWPEMQNVFLASTTILVTHQEFNEYQNLIGKLLGYPVRLPRKSDENEILYMDETERHALIRETGDENICCVPGFQYFDDKGTESTWRGCLVHYLRCIEVMKGVGSDLILDAEEHEPLRAFILEQQASERG